MLSVSMSRNAWWVSVNGEKEASSNTARTEPSNSTGTTITFNGVAEPSPELLRT